MMRIAPLTPLLLAAGLACMAGCSSPDQPTGQRETLASINAYQLSLDEFQRQLAAEVELEKDYKLTEKAREEFLESVIRKELLIQEAVRLKLDREERFVKAMEKHWESTLIRELVDLKGREISGAITVSEKEIAKRHATLFKTSPEIGPLTGKLRKRLREELKAAKKTSRINQWIKSLRQRATVEINEELLTRN